jgi:5-hydroxyisourate hydrolase-like protein (transthyretin family)
MKRQKHLLGCVLAVLITLVQPSTSSFAGASRASQANNTFVPMMQSGTGAISGVVTAEDTGLPLADVSVNVCYAQDNGQCGMGGTAAITPASGQYTVTLLPGKYFVSFAAVGEYASEKYQDRQFGEMPDVVTVTANTSITINVALARAPKITGVVTAEDTGLPLAGVTVKMCRLAYPCSWETTIAYTQTQADGHYTMSVPPDVYTVNFESAGYYIGERYPDKSLYDISDVLTFTANTTTTINAVLAKGGQIAGVVTAADTGQAVPYTWAIACVNNKCDAARAWTDNTNHYALTLKPGDYEVLFWGNEIYASEKYNNKPKTQIGDRVTVITGATTTINVSLDRNAVINGVVTADDTGLPLADVYVSAIEVVPNGWPSFWRGYGAQTAHDGSYTLSVDPGPYRLEFSGKDDYKGEKYDNQPSDLPGDVITLTANTTRTINVSLSK